MELLNNVTEERRELAGGITKYRVVRDAHRTVCSERSLKYARRYDCDKARWEGHYCLERSAVS
jgi:hypothetical protein